MVKSCLCSIDLSVQSPTQCLCYPVELLIPLRRPSRRACPSRKSSIHHSILQPCSETMSLPKRLLWYVASYKTKRSDRRAMTSRLRARATLIMLECCSFPAQVTLRENKVAHEDIPWRRRNFLIFELDLNIGKLLHDFVGVPKVALEHLD